MISFNILFFLFWSIVIIGLIVFFARRRKKGAHPANDKEWYLQFVLSKEDAVSQFFILLSIFFLGVTLLAFNRDLGDPFSWRTILFITSAFGLISAYYLKAFYALAFGLIGTTAWWGAQATEWIQGKDIKTSAIFAGLAFVALLFYSLGHLHEREMKWKRFALVYLGLGIISITGVLFFLSTKSGLFVLGDMTKGVSFFGSWRITLSLFIFLAALVGVAFYTMAKKLVSPFEFLAILLLTFLFGVIALLPQQSMFLQVGDSYNYYSGDQELSSSGVLWAIIFNFVVFFELLGLIFSGYLRRETWLINLGALFLFLLIVVKYFDWFFTFLDKSIFFISAGILLFVVGWFMERGRKYMISNIKTQSQQIPQ
ncbi:MAG: hypothetical protein COU46_02215 [Candidatus Niyogibacteria bacterium CG10_big_fil_rev_8_21_14_0_10_42_19]|uniref:DUF2157 domain-containing protein n=1 Tax=Candidatus Niyogibacteria bacterium CG10_big_fil_rev_8_21_14_0_10_42_19 TaxID=1974725 RepID=A0A2H0TFH5_9BACT|nr:MAG: hypothetical protein COU46_02215 [Candidatus Niyogibacteria bacterium CG10_big_fil_rev_8_21_14_0_10_42_19]